ncbi:MAG: OmpH family outer membrane protein [Nitrospirota bacterium]|jgi:outer membrane protein
MRKILTVVFVLALSASAFAQDGMKIGFVDMQRALNESEAGKVARVELEEAVKERQGVISEKMAMRDKLVAELEKQSVVLSEEARKQKQAELATLSREVERMVEESNAELQKRQRELETEIVRDLDSIITTIGKQGGYTLILPAEIILYSVEGLEITGQVIDRHNALYKAKQGEGVEGSEE